MPLCTPCFQLRGKTLCLCALYFQLSYCEAASEDFCFAAPLMPKNASGGMLLPDHAELTKWSCNRSGLAAESTHGLKGALRSQGGGKSPPPSVQFKLYQGEVLQYKPGASDPLARPLPTLPRSAPE